MISITDILISSGYVIGIIMIGRCSMRFLAAAGSIALIVLKKDFFF
jgi:hypothetical protein